MFGPAAAKKCLYCNLLQPAVFVFPVRHGNLKTAKVSLVVADSSFDTDW